MKVNFFELSKLSTKEREKLLVRKGVDLRDLIAKVAPILDAIRDRGDEAVREFTKAFDGAELSAGSLKTSTAEMDQALLSLDARLREAMEVSIANITKFHERQVEPPSWEMEISPGVIAGEKVIPLDSVGLYVPRGKGSFPSMMMMAGVPAKVAGVRRIVVVSPPDNKGKADPATLAAARIIGIDEVYAIGGVQAIGALAYGTESIPRVDKIVGPGSGYVLAAKQIVGSQVDTGLPAGPSESIVLADDSVETLVAVTDLLIEAEHGPDSSAYLVTPDKSTAKSALELIPQLVSRLPEERRSYCEAVFSSNGGVVLAQDLEDAIRFIDEFAPEHLQILTRDPEAVLSKVRFAGEALLGYIHPGPWPITPSDQTRFCRLRDLRGLLQPFLLEISSGK